VDEPVPPIVPVGDEGVGDGLDPPPPLPKATAAPAPAATPAIMTTINVFEMPCDDVLGVLVVVAAGVAVPLAGLVVATAGVTVPLAGPFDAATVK